MPFRATVNCLHSGHGTSANPFIGGQRITRGLALGSVSGLRFTLIRSYSETLTYFLRAFFFCVGSEDLGTETTRASAAWNRSNGD